ncbi:MAG: ABC transporter substrate-binding protein [Mycobacteriaceae bacterium]
MHSARVRLILASVLAVLTLATACGSGNSGSVAQAATSDAKAGELRLGFFANVTHAPALVGVAEGILAKDLGATTLSTQVFNAGPATIEALRAGSLDAAYVGPSAAILGFSQTKGQVLRIVSGAASGGAQLVVRDTIGSAAELKGKTIASPQLGNTQDVALRAWLAKQGLKTGVSGGGDVTIAPQDDATTLQLFRDGKIDGAWLPEPWASRLVVDAKAKVLVDEKSLWPQGQFATTQLIVRTEFLNTFPGTVKDLLTANLDAIDFITANNGKAKQDTNEQIGKLAGKPLSQNVIDRAWPNLTFTADPLASTLQRSADDAVAAGTTQKADLRGIVNVTVLNGLLSARGKPAVSDAGLGRG